MNTIRNGVDIGAGESNQLMQIGSAAVLQAVSGVPVVAGTGHVTGDVLTLSGGTSTTAAKVAVATAKVASASANAHGSGYAAGDLITVSGGTATTAAVLAVATMDMPAIPTISAAGTGYVPADTITLAVTSSTSSVKTVVTVATTKVVSATVQSGGTGDLGDGAGVIVQGTTGTGTKFHASVTIASNAIASVQSISLAGSYTVNPTVIGVEPVTYISGAASGTILTGAALAVVMGALTITMTTPGTYTVGGVAATQFGTSGSGTGATFTGCLFGVKTVTVSNAGDYSTSNASFTQASVSPVGGTGATFNTVSYGVKTVSIDTAGVYSILPASPVSQGASTGVGINATFTMTWGIGPVVLAN